MNNVKSISCIQQRHVAMLAFPECMLLDICGPMEVFNMANEGLRLRGQIAPKESVYSLSIVAETKGSIKTSSGISIVADKSYDDLQGGVDTLLVAGSAHIESATHDEKMHTWLKKMKPKVRRMGSICSGALVLAECGFLDGRRATTHWIYCDDMVMRYPKVQVEPNRIFIRDGEVYTSGGVTAGIDMALSLVEEDWGWELASGVARAMLMFMRRPGGQSQFSTYVFNEAKNRKDFRELQGWISANPQADLSVEKLAEKMNMSSRNFSRLFIQEIGLTPAKFVERVRLEAARNMMSQTDLPLEVVATNCGFGSAEQMRRTFQRLLKTTPQEQRTYFKVAGCA